MYIIVKENAPLGHAINCAAHAAVGVFVKFQNHQDTQEWIKSSFRKVTCVASDDEFEMMKQQPDSFLMIEDDLNGGKEVALGFRPRREWPKAFWRLRLYGSKQKTRQATVCSGSSS